MGGEIHQSKNGKEMIGKEVSWACCAKRFRHMGSSSSRRLKASAYFWDTGHLVIQQAVMPKALCHRSCVSFATCCCCCLRCYMIAVFRVCLIAPSDAGANWVPSKTSFTL